VLEHRALQTAGLLTERTRRTLWQAQHGQPRHVAACEPGELVCLDTFYIGQLKGVGKVWQITACDAACSYGVAWLLPAHTAEAAAHFLRRVVLPLYRRAGWRLRRVLTDGGPEFNGGWSRRAENVPLILILLMSLAMHSYRLPLLGASCHIPFLFLMEFRLPEPRGRGLCPSLPCRVTR
jgi:hypothetical protein